RAFEPVAAAVETVAPAVEVLHPGACVLPARGPSRYYGSDQVVVDRVARAVEHVTGPGGCRVGIADGVFAACQAARLGEIVTSGATPGFLAELPVGVLDVPDVTDQLQDQVLACTVVAIQAETTAGRRLVRRWRHEDGLTPDALAERVRWQIEAWLRRAEDGPAAGGSPVEGGLVRLVLSPELVHAE